MLTYESGIVTRRTPMTDIFVGDNDHGDPSKDIIKEIDWYLEIWIGSTVEQNIMQRCKFEILKLRHDIDWHQSQDVLSQILIEQLRKKINECEQK